MLVLLLFNSNATITIKQIQTETEMSLEIIHDVLCDLSEKKIIVCDEFENLNRRKSSIRLTKDFQSTKMHVKLCVPFNCSEGTKNNDKKFAIQALIIRIMKTKGTLFIESLIDEVMTEMNQPNENIIRNCIDRLIEQEYLERDSRRSNLLHYLL
ncbi:unnamed protein product [Adineta ricciae]|nr:unnamed protein product [Adineta ricciae]